MHVKTCPLINSDTKTYYNPNNFKIEIYAQCTTYTTRFS